MFFRKFNCHYAIIINNEKQYFEEYETKGLVEEIINLLIMNITDFIFEYNPETNSYVLKGSKDKEIMYLVIPATHKKLPVTEIADNAFANYENLEQVSFSSNIKQRCKTIYSYNSTSK